MTEIELTNLYLSVASKCGIVAPELFFDRLPKNVLAICKTHYFETKRELISDKFIVIDSLQINGAVQSLGIRHDYILAHELVHFVATNEICGGGETLDNQDHGHAFLAGLVFCMRKLKYSKIERQRCIDDHVNFYNLDRSNLEKAVKAGLSAQKISAAINSGSVVTPLKFTEKLGLAGIIACGVFVAFNLVQNLK